MQTEILNSIQENIDNFTQLKSLAPEIEKVAKVCIDAIKNGHKVMFCGNGGSAADSQHLAAELVGRYKMNRPAMNAIALTTDTSIITSIGNDYGYDDIFERQVEGLGLPGDVLIGISTSGNSKNVIRAMEKAKSKQIINVAFTGMGGGRMREYADYLINVPSEVTNHIQEMHITVGHLICGLIESSING
ncbi:MAG: D-sedoheptulose 7-phosphate isomerase [Alphaproteobacteria bacterium]|nr:D-sedoheptulose 7-phosphate isomerase [Alphaproteobacteria bacterium]